MSTLKARKAAPKVAAPKTPSRTAAQRFEPKVDRSGGPDACHPWKGSIGASNGYGRFWFEGKQVEAHVAAWLIAQRAEHGDHYQIAEGKIVCHTCNNKLCQNPRHEYEGTRKTNMQDAARDGVQGKRVLNRDKARAIFKSHYVDGVRQKVLAKQYGCTPENIRHVLARRSWVKATDDLVHLTKKPAKARKSTRATQPEARV